MSLHLLPMLVAIGSSNPTKIRAVEVVVRQVWPDAQFLAQEVPSDVPAQPLGNRQTRAGALNRARAVLKATGADWGAGLEGGVIETELGMMTTAWCAIVDREGRIGTGGAANMLLPEAVAKRVRAGVELGEAMDEYANVEDVKRRMGAIGILPRGLIDRQGAYECLVKLALARFLWEDKQ